MEALQILKFALKNGHILSFTEGTGKLAEIAYLEKGVSDPAPQTIHEFIHYLNTASGEDIGAEDDDLYV